MQRRQADQTPILRRRLAGHTAAIDPISVHAHGHDRQRSFEICLESLTDQLQDAMRDLDQTARPDSRSAAATYEPSLVHSRSLTDPRPKTTLTKTRRRSTISRWTTHLLGLKSKPVFKTEAKIDIETENNLPSVEEHLDDANEREQARCSSQASTTKASDLNNTISEPSSPIPSTVSKAVATEMPESATPPKVTSPAVANSFEPVELQQFIPDAEQPPSMHPNWRAAPSQAQVLTDRYGFKLGDARARRRALSERFESDISNEDAADEADDFRCATVHPLTPDSGYARSQEDLQPGRKPASISSASANQTIQQSLASKANLTRPLTPETDINAPDVVIQQNTAQDETARLLLALSQQDTNGPERARRDAWENFLRKLRNDRHRPGSDSIIDQQDSDLAGIGTGRMAKERMKELSYLLYAGIPVDLRPRLWAELTGACFLKRPLYYSDLLMNPHKDADPLCVQQIDLDIKRTMPSNTFFSGTGSGVAKLRRVLIAFSRHNPEIGYCQGMNNIAATLLLTYPTEEDVFFVLVSIVEKLLPASYFTVDLLASRADQHVLKQFVQELCPRIHAHLSKLGADLEAITFGWFLSVFTDCLPSEWLFRTWDVFFVEGHPYLFCAAIAILQMHERLILMAEHPGAIYTILKELEQTRSIHVDKFIKMTERVRSMTRKNAKYDVHTLQAAAMASILAQHDSGI